MKNFKTYLIILFILPAFIFTSCKEKNNDPTETTFEVLKDYLTTNSMDLSDILSYHGTNGDIKFVTAPPATDAEVAGFAAGYYIMDIRSATDYNAGHITGANQVDFANILTAAASADKRILVVCYTGQTACYATALLRLYGYPDAQALKWGMSGWNATYDKWTTSIGSIADGHNNWTNAAAPTNVKYEDPEITENSTDGEAILKARVEAAVAAGFKKVQASDVLETPANYFINNYFSEPDYLGFGHIDGAYRISPLTLADDIYANLDPDKQIVTYCYTGQTSAVITAYLNILGYDAYSLLFGMNKLFNSSAQWSVNQWGGDSNPKSLSTVPTVNK